MQIEFSSIEQLVQSFERYGLDNMAVRQLASREDLLTYLAAHLPTTTTSQQDDWHEMWIGMMASNHQFVRWAHAELRQKRIPRFNEYWSQTMEAPALHAALTTLDKQILHELYEVNCQFDAGLSVVIDPSVHHALLHALHEAIISCQDVRADKIRKLVAQCGADLPLSHKNAVQLEITIRNALRRYGIVNLVELTQMSEADVLAIPRIGKTTLESIRRVLSMYNLGFAPSHENHA